MSAALLRKELHEHGAVLGPALLLGALGLLGLLIRASEGGGRFVGLVLFSLLFGPLFALVLANRLLVREYAGRTLLFLEPLPISRGKVFATKWLLGGALTLAVAAAAWSATVLFIRHAEVLSWRDSLGPLLSVATYWLTLWSFAAMAGMLGRYRYVVWGALLIALFMANEMAGIAMFDLPVVRLLGADVQMARGFPAASAFLVALAVTAVCIAGAAALAFSGSGAAASVLAHRMTARERVFVLVSLIALLVTTTLLEPKPVQPPFKIVAGEHFDGRFAAVGVMPTADVDAAAAGRLARTIAEDADTLIDALELDARPSVFIVPQQGLDRFAAQRAALGNARGIVLRIAADAPGAFVRARVIHALLSEASRGRGLKEDRHVLLDGLAAYWVLRDDAEARQRWWLRAASVDVPLDAGALTAWSRTEERLGDCVSMAAAFSVFDALVERAGRPQALRLMRQLLETPPDDVRVLLEPSPAERLADHSLSWRSLAVDAEAARQRARARFAAELSRRSAITARVDWQESRERGIEIRTTVHGTKRYSVYYSLLGPWTADVGDLPRFDVLGSVGTLPLSPPHGARVLVAIEIDDPILDCPVRLLADRMELR